MTTSPETPTRTTGAQRAHEEKGDRAAARSPAQAPPGRHEAQLDGLFTYCLSVLCDHDAATAALADALRVAERRRGPATPDDHRAWLYALARWACLRELAGAREKRQGAHASGRPGTDERREPDSGPPVPPRERARRQHDIARLAWPEAAGTTPAQREALELAVRHRLTAHEIAAVLGSAPASARELLASAACEVERTRAALAVVEAGTCPGVARLSHDHRLVLGTTLRRELVRHVDDCPRCRRTAERAAPGRWPGTSVTPAALPLVEAPRADLRTAMTHLTRARGGSPRFDRRGFPLDLKGRAARRDRLRARAVTTTVVATVVAAPVLAVWAAFRSGQPAGGEATEGPAAATAREAHEPDRPDGPDDGTGDYRNAGDAGSGPGRPGEGASGIGMEVHGDADPGAGALTVRAIGDGDTMVITLTATGSAPVAWSAHTDAGWLYFGRSRGTLAPGASDTVDVHVDRLREPAGHWSARVSIAPAGAVVPVEGYGPDSRPSSPRPAPPGPTAPSAPPPTPTSGPEPTPSAPASSTPTPGPPTPTDPAGPAPSPGDDGTPSAPAGD
ncbi:hypothetical protein GCM10010145_67050 [Streptomyces ruber]|uniref:BACON domain-containing protein n=2 Tax=Streptomyces TaxID=1883 RepID=A0A918EXS9_9ACTN|nr:hypothetical protein [Streptomyces ruber]GGQ88199.1 hypothetical protein GCM10010145_67050 [Streptomyces ruber]